MLRSLYWTWRDSVVPEAYYAVVRGELSLDELFSSTPEAELSAMRRARNATLGETPELVLDGWIKEAIGKRDPWILIGGPPCQAYSLVGRARMRGTDPAGFAADRRHTLYREFLRVLRKHRPAVFIMENVKGLLSSKHQGDSVFGRILRDFSAYHDGTRYEVRSLVAGGSPASLRPEDFIVRSEAFGVPQCRHRVILFGVRADLVARNHELLSPSLRSPLSVDEVISDLPPLRSRLSREDDSPEEWVQVLREACRTVRRNLTVRLRPVLAEMELATQLPADGIVMKPSPGNPQALPDEYGRWVTDPRIHHVSLHDTRAHMREDISRYLFASAFARVYGRSPLLTEFPTPLLPRHENAHHDQIPFPDRFRVQLAKTPSTTIVSHIAKDGHYYIHYDPSQCRSLTVREAARLQTFPDNYYFAGNRTAQYTQVGNAVPPLLACRIAGILHRFLAI